MTLLPQNADMQYRAPFYHQGSSMQPGEGIDMRGFASQSDQSGVGPQEANHVIMAPPATGDPVRRLDFQRPFTPEGFDPRESQFYNTSVSWAQGTTPEQMFASTNKRREGMGLNPYADQADMDAQYSAWNQAMAERGQAFRQHTQNPRFTPPPNQRPDPYIGTSWEGTGGPGLAWGGPTPMYPPEWSGRETVAPWTADVMPQQRPMPPGLGGWGGQSGLSGGIGSVVGGRMGGGFGGGFGGGQGGGGQMTIPVSAMLQVSGGGGQGGGMHQMQGFAEGGYIPEYGLGGFLEKLAKPLANIGVTALGMGIGGPMGAALASGLFSGITDKSLKSGLLSGITAFAGAKALDSAGKAVRGAQAAAEFKAPELAIEAVTSPDGLLTVPSLPGSLLSDEAVDKLRQEAVSTAVNSGRVGAREGIGSLFRGGGRAALDDLSSAENISFMYPQMGNLAQSLEMEKQEREGRGYVDPYIADLAAARRKYNNRYGPDPWKGLYSRRKNGGMIDGYAKGGLTYTNPSEISWDVLNVDDILGTDETIWTADDEAEIDDYLKEKGTTGTSSDETTTRSTPRDTGSDETTIRSDPRDTDEESEFDIYVPSTDNADNAEDPLDEFEFDDNTTNENTGDNQNVPIGDGQFDPMDEILDEQDIYIPETGPIDDGPGPQEYDPDDTTGDDSNENPLNDPVTGDPLDKGDEIGPENENDKEEVESLYRSRYARDIPEGYMPGFMPEYDYFTSDPGDTAAGELPDYNGIGILPTDMPDLDSMFSDDAVSQMLSGISGLSDSVIPGKAAGGPIPSKDELVEMTLRAISGEMSPEAAEQVISKFVEMYGEEALMQLAAMAERDADPMEGMVEGSGAGMDDDVLMPVQGQTPVALSGGEFVIPADAVSMLGDGNSQAGADLLQEIVDGVRAQKTGTPQQAAPINFDQLLGV